MVVGIGAHEHHRVGVAQPLLALARPRVGPEQEDRRRFRQRQAALAGQLLLGRGREPLVRRLHAVAEREVSGEAPGGDPEDEDREADADPAQRAPPRRPYRPLPGRLRARRPAVPSLRARQRRQPRRPATPAVNAVRLLFRGHAAGYGSRRSWRPSATIGIDVGGTKILAGVVERDGTVLRTERRETPTESTQAFLEGLAAVADAPPRRQRRRSRHRHSVDDRPARRQLGLLGPRPDRGRAAARARRATTWGCRSRSTTTRTQRRSPNGRSARAAVRSTWSC